MPYTAASPIRRAMQRSEVDLDRLTAWAVRNGAQHEDYLDEYFGVLLAGCLYTGIDFWVLAGQGYLETNNWTSSWWVNRGNPAGLGITGDPGQNSGSQTWETGEQSAFAHLSHMTAYLWGEDWIDHWNETWPDPIDANRRFTAPIRAGYRATVLDDLNGTWAIDPQNKYGEKIADRANLLREEALGKETEPVALKIRQAIIPAGRRNRPGTKLNSGGLWLTTHDTGNPGRGANAEMHRAFVHNPNTSVSFHFTVDDKEAIQLLPLDEIGYHAGDGCNNRNTDRGCFASAATELCINSDGDWWQAYANLKDLYAAIITGDPRINYGGRQGDFHETRLTTHNAVSDDRKWCPATILNRGLVADLTAGVVNRVKIIRDGATPAPEPDYAKTYPVGKGTQLINGHLFLAPGGKTVQREQAPMQFADANNVPTGPAFPKGHKFTQEDITHYVQGTDGNLWVILEDGSRFPAMAFVEDAA